MRQFYVYIMANRSRTLYAGMTNDLAGRVWEHKHMLADGFTKRYLIDRLVYYEVAGDVSVAIRREKRIKGWVRRKEIALIESVNPEWRDLSAAFLDIRPTVPAVETRAVQESGRRDSSLLTTDATVELRLSSATNAPGRLSAQNDDIQRAVS